MSQESETRQFSSPQFSSPCESDLYNVLYADYHFIRHTQLKVKQETYSKPPNQWVLHSPCYRHLMTVDI